MNEGPSVLYIDDDDGLRRLVARALARRGYQVALADRGEDGIALATATRYDVIAVDHYMPGLDGLQTLARLQALPAPPPVVYVTGTDEGRVAIAALKAGAADYVVKSVGEDFFDLLTASLDQVRERALLAEQKVAAEEGLRASNVRLEALLGEVNHRVANSLQLVAAMVRLQASAVEAGAAREALADTQRRIEAIAQVHRRLYTGSDVENVDMRDYLGALVAELGDTWSSEAARRTLRFEADEVRLPTDRAVSLGVIVTELVTNACKYAYPAGGGEVRVALRHRGDDAFCLSVEDDGCGIGAEPSPGGTGLGTRLIRAMAQSLRSTLEYDPGHAGTRVTLTAALR
jgi:two-component sensor histidine kinase